MDAIKDLPNWARCPRCGTKFTFQTEEDPIPWAPTWGPECPKCGFHDDERVMTGYLVFREAFAALLDLFELADQRKIPYVNPDDLITEEGVGRAVGDALGTLSDFLHYEKAQYQDAMDILKRAQGENPNVESRVFLWDTHAYHQTGLSGEELHPPFDRGPDTLLR